MTTNALPPTRAFADVTEGDELPELVVEVTPTMIIAGALATRDYQDVHHDRDLAVERGSKDIFMNILTTNAWVGRFVTDWAGPNAIVQAINVRLGVPNYPYDTMRMTGRIAKKTAAVAGGGLVEIAIRGGNSMGDHVTGSVRVMLP